MGKFIKLIDKNYKSQDPQSKLEYVGSIIFDFTTYCGEVDALFAKKMLPVIESIVNNTTFEYIGSSDENYINYLTMVNMPFLVNKLEWGTSIRGAWFDESKEYEIDCGRIIIKKQEINEFVKDLLVWINEPKE